MTGRAANGRGPCGSRRKTRTSMSRCGISSSATVESTHARRPIDGQAFIPQAIVCPLRAVGVNTNWLRRRGACGKVLEYWPRSSGTQHLHKASDVPRLTQNSDCLRSASCPRLGSPQPTLRMRCHYGYVLQWRRYRRRALWQSRIGYPSEKCPDNLEKTHSGMPTPPGRKCLVQAGFRSLRVRSSTAGLPS